MLYAVFSIRPNDILLFSSGSFHKNRLPLHAENQTQICSRVRKPFTSVHICSPPFTSFHFVSLRFTCFHFSFHLLSRPFTYVHFCSHHSHDVTWFVHFCSYRFTSCSFPFTSVHIYSHPFTCVHSQSLLFTHTIRSLLFIYPFSSVHIRSLMLTSCSHYVHSRSHTITFCGRLFTFCIFGWGGR